MNVKHKYKFYLLRWFYLLGEHYHLQLPKGYEK